jgi:membrane-bound lytic murein transglycosylase B
MADARFGRAQKASALLPLAVLSVAWTASLATAGSDAASAGSDTLPDGTQVPAQAVRVPASVTAPHTLTPGIRGPVSDVVSTASASGIPAVALAAYQRAATVIDAADHSCHMPWQLVAAIGRVESDHGRADGNVLTDRGIAKPGIFGPALDGTHGTSMIRDTDAGQYDHDSRYDRAVGPMQFIPSTWAIVGVDADNDGQRNPQDIYDASLGSAVYLCSGSDDLGTDAGQRSAVLRYNHSQRYVDLVLAITRAYLDGDFSSVPNGTTSTGFSFGTPPAAIVALGHHRHHHHGGKHHAHHQSTSSTTAGGPGQQPTSGPTTGPGAEPTSNPTTAPTGGLPTNLPVPSSLPTLLPTATPTILTKAEAVVQCLAEGLVDNPLDPADAFDQCVYDLTH